MVGLATIAMACGPASETTLSSVHTGPDSPAGGPGTSAATHEGGPTAVVQPDSRPSDTLKVGSMVGDHIPEFTLLLADGGSVRSADLLAANRPTFLYFFATW